MTKMSIRGQITLVLNLREESSAGNAEWFR